MKHPMFFENPSCAGLDTNMLYPDEGTMIEYESKVEKICNNCLEYSDCLEWALHNELYGYWAGTNAKDRKRLRKAMNIVLGPYHSENYVDVGSIRAGAVGNRINNDAA